MELQVVLLWMDNNVDILIRLTSVGPMMEGMYIFTAYKSKETVIYGLM